MSVPRLVATDLDGTLLRSDGSVSAHTASVLSDVLDRGVEVAFVTARPWRWMSELWAYVGSRGLAVVSNGALLLDVATGQPLEVHGIEPEVGLPLVDAIRTRVPGSQFAIEMLRWAGRGVAMGQAVDVVLEAADAVTDTVHDEGAATELGRWFRDGASGTSSRHGCEVDER